MAQTPGIVIAGPAGRMGRMLIAAVQGTEGVRLAGALVRPGHAWDGADLGEALGGVASGVPVGSDAAAMLAGAAALIDFTAGPATAGFAAAAARAGVVHVVGTSGLNDTEMAALDAAARDTVVVFSGNMSLGVNILAQMTRQVAAALDADFDIEIVEAHHRHKVDAPSGTAMMLGEAAAEGRGADLREVSDRGRDGHTGPRRRGNIGFSAIRAGDIVGEHDVIFAGAGERIVLRHVATDRGIYARGALKAAQWGIGRAPGRYSMLDVLGL